jgi:23S rRNA pseudouridine955/2504/2580 synthase
MKNIIFEELILLENEDYLVINKPPHVSTLDDRNDPFSILALAKEYNPSAQVCHRLDKETSGALAIAKNPEAYREMSMQFEHRTVKKIYHAVVAGIHSFKNHEVNAPIQILPKGSVKIDHHDGKPAQTIFDTLRAYKTHTLVECKPVTGRMHQIRIHLSYLKAPIVSDVQYGGKMFYLSDIKKKFNLKKDTDEMPLINRVGLHAYALEFKLMNGEQIKVEAPYPKDFGVLIRQLEKNN